MSSEKGIILKVDPQKRIGINDVIEMLKGLRDETLFEVVKTYEKNTHEGNLFHNAEIKNKSNNVTGNTELPQIRELNEIAALLRSMDNEKGSL